MRSFFAQCLFLLVAVNEKPAAANLTPVHALDQALLSRLRANASSQEDRALSFVCSEVVWPDGGPAARTDLLLLRKSLDVVEWRSSRQRTRASEITPPAFAWTLLFSKRLEPFIAVCDHGVSLDGFQRLHGIAFRGALSYSSGSDIREWEGQLLLDADSLEPLILEATPSGQTARLTALYYKHERSTRVSVSLFGGTLLAARLGPRPIGRRLRVRFDRQHDGLVLPVESHLEVFRQVSGAGAEQRLLTLHRRYQDCRRFSTEERATISGNANSPGETRR